MVDEVLLFGGGPPSWSGKRELVWRETAYWCKANPRKIAKVWGRSGSYEVRYVEHPSDMKAVDHMLSTNAVDPDAQPQPPVTPRDPRRI